MKEFIRKIVTSLRDRLSLLLFFIKRKKWELLPIIILLIIFGLILLAAESPLLAPFIYTVF